MLGRSGPLGPKLLVGTASLAALSCGLQMVGTVDPAPDPDAGDAGVVSDASSSASEGTAPDAGVPTSCAALVAVDSTTAVSSGLYDIDPDGPGPAAPLRVYCEMSIDRGGWTLVGRSAEDADDVPFGWTSATGTVADPASPYSIDVLASKLAFTEVMIADRDPISFAVGTRAYKFAIGPDFLSAHANNTVATGGVTTLVGDCNPPGGPSMLKFAGAVSFTDTFFLRDIPDLGQHRGLRRDGWDLAYDDCDRGGSLDGAQGLIFVR
ncbi:MAG: hypothetical protein KF764_23770 [Labilithrix sp.]|nr:hypothetical protein [Labilithrix sp.]MBX3223675.1 hypothetical protein [Labilithrix sp.]